MLEALETAVKSVTHDWKEAKRQADRQDRVRQQDLERMWRARKTPQLNVKQAAYMAMEQAYMKASNNGRLPANARQIMYAARPRVLELTNGKCWKVSSYFTQHLLPDYIEEHPGTTASWDVVFDARGHLREPHTEEELGLGTIEVRKYMAGWLSAFGEGVSGVTVKHAVATSGPANRFKFALFTEKEGFDQLWEAVHLAERFDLAIMSTKGMSVTAARTLVERLSRAGVTILVLHDFDKAGFSILHTLQSDTRRYRFRTLPNVVDLGLRLADVKAMGLQSEPVDYEGNVDPRLNLTASGATREECDFLVKSGGYGGWTGQRVEINAMTSDQLVAWLEKKLEDLGVKKVVPEQALLEGAYRRAVRLRAQQRAIDEALAKYKEADNIDVPADLLAKVTSLLEEEPQIAWDDAVWDLSREQFADEDEHPL